MAETTTMVGSRDALVEVLNEGELLSLGAPSGVAVVMTAAAFVGAAPAALALADVFHPTGASVEALMILDRAALAEAEGYFAARIAAAEVVVLADGSALHAKSVWYDTAVGAAIRDANALVTIGSIASVLGAIMIDPRGGAPTVGLNYRAGPVVTGPASDEQLTRTRSLLGEDETLVVLGHSGVLHLEHGAWRHVRGDAVITRGTSNATL